MKILAAFDSFKESMSAIEAGEAVKKASCHTVIIKALADGGEGTMDAVNDYLKGNIHTVEVTGPLFEKTSARLSICNDLAIIESAQACGLDLLTEEKKNALLTTTYGVGEMILYAYNHQVRNFMITLGGSSTNDGGAGMLSALGIRFYNKEKHPIIPTARSLKDIDEIDLSEYLLKDCHFIAACDVTNPLTGIEGATYIFGPQKKIKKEDLQEIDKGMSHYADKTAYILSKDNRDYPGAGAAGGLGFAIVSYLNGQLKSGFDMVASYTCLEEAIKEADIIFTGEGKMDRQTLQGKTPFGVLQLAKKYHKKVIAFSGRVEDKELLLKAGFENVYCINHEDLPLKELLKKGKDNLYLEVKRYCDEYL